MVDVGASPHRARGGCPGDGRLEAQARHRADPPYGSRVAIHCAFFRPSSTPRASRSRSSSNSGYGCPAQVGSRRGTAEVPGPDVYHVQPRAGLLAELHGGIRRAGGLLRAVGCQQYLGGKDAVSIRKRPPEVEDRAVLGHWEGDLLSGAHNTHIATLVERGSRFAMLVRVGGEDTTSVVGALSSQIRQLPDTMTWDRGTEMADHKKFAVATDVRDYFCDPKSPWQRGTSENTNRLLRQYLPKGTNLSTHDQHDLDAIALKLNSRPRKPSDTALRLIHWHPPLHSPVEPTTVLLSAARCARRVTRLVCESWRSLDSPWQG